MPSTPSISYLSYVNLPNTGVTTVQFDVPAFEDAINQQGIVLVHYRSMRCPVGLTSKRDDRRPGGHEFCKCSNGFIYTKVGEIKALFTSNSESYNQSPVGVIDGSTASITLQRYYNDTEQEVHVAPFDRFYLADTELTVPNWQLFETSGTSRDRMQYPVDAVQDLMDSDGNVYSSNDVTIVKGDIVWGNVQPHWNADLKKGSVCAIRYTYRPFYYVRSLSHQVRHAQVTDLTTGLRNTVRMPQAFSAEREYLFEKDENQPNSTNPRQDPLPPNGFFGPR